MYMHIIRTFLLAAVTLLVMASCLGEAEGSSVNGFSQVDKEVVYANQEKSYIAFAAYGDNWKIVKTGGDDWCTLSSYTGKGGYLYAIWATCQMNRTGKYRSAEFKLQSQTDEGVYVQFNVYQYACRHDGSFGNAALVKTITGDDGSLIELTYDSQARPSTVKLSKDGQLLRSLAYRFNDADSTLTVVSNTSTQPLQGRYQGGYQLENRLASPTDTLSFDIQYDTYAFSAFTLRERHGDGSYDACSMSFKNQKFTADEEHVADSMKIQRYVPGEKANTLKMKLEYLEVDNRYQSVDVNQLLLGIERCNPYHLVATYRYSRNSKVIKTASMANGSYTVDAERNADNSVKTLRVTDPDKHTITYTFAY